MSRLILAALVALAVSGCGILYKQPIYQGNLIEQSSVDQLQAGMDKQQVMALMGTPAVASPFHHQRWDYTATRRTNRRGTTEIKNLTLWFENDALARWEGEYFPEDDAALAQEVRKFGHNLPRERNNRRR
ncbi:outer membrane protein assembly factor BamE [Luteimonas aestuarii]|uniref:Outer membrane protein assembly factor BamE n=1 Tax=Luteimonas aestuarii TaxID=453837 RepID=A0A4R5TN96_9GAMM|nr:outer membrane protein assembly factor BamE [Luteimonas aestuarii]TDK23423.1 outer membrane protein assembly factor BamE [Luteimonas aestuarii]